jgi:hypothetical protein
LFLSVVCPSDEKSGGDFEEQDREKKKGKEIRGEKDQILQKEVSKVL